MSLWVYVLAILSAFLWGVSPIINKRGLSQGGTVLQCTLVVVGVFLLVAGVVVLVFSKGGDIRGWPKTALWIPLAGAGTFALGNSIRRYGLASTSIPVLEALVINQTAAFAALSAFALVRRRRDVLRAPPRTYLFFTGGGLFAAAALMIFFEALKRGPVAIMDPLSGTQPLFATLLAIIWLRDLERVTLGLIVGTLMVVLGAALVMGSEVSAGI